MADFADIGTATTEVCQADALRRQLGKSAPDAFDPAFDGESCVDCADHIHSARLAMGRVRCVECQEWLDKTQKMARLNRRVE